MDTFTRLLVSSVHQFLGDFHVLSHGTYASTLHPLFSGDGSSIHMCRPLGSPFRQAHAEELSWQDQRCWDSDCDWVRQNVRGRKEEMTLLCSWGTGPQHFTDMSHPWQAACSKAVNWVQDVCVLLVQSFTLKSNCLCSFQLLLLLLLCCKICSRSVLAFLDLLALWK